MVEAGDLKDIINSEVKRFFVNDGTGLVVDFVEEGLK